MVVDSIHVSIVPVEIAKLLVAVTSFFCSCLIRTSCGHHHRHQLQLHAAARHPRSCRDPPPHCRRPAQPRATKTQGVQLDLGTSSAGATCAGAGGAETMRRRYAPAAMPGAWRPRICARDPRPRAAASPRDPRRRRREPRATPGPSPRSAAASAARWWTWSDLSPAAARAVAAS